MKKLIALLFALMTVMTLMIPVFASAEENAPMKTMWVNCANGKTLNLRAEPSTGSRRLASLECGTRVDVMYEAEVPGWAYVVPRGHRDGGFVMTKFLVESKPGKYEITERDDNFRTVQPYTVTALALNDRTNNSVGLRTAPNKTAKMIRRLAAGDQLRVLEVGKTWSKVVDLATGNMGFVANDYMIRL
jgi:uncharacterized protein YgiM (DUF1202 family)